MVRLFAQGSARNARSVKTRLSAVLERAVCERNVSERNEHYAKRACLAHCNFNVGVIYG